ncbi:four helix bundle protein [Chryseobacterium rhizoplanae]|uniref:four helix bundle protein n=1 Tax=Chryseobacterium rhizoplanae TaxID=1609531 RepID=UPI001CE3AD92|nr:four helix bundle protein [Chryseobacterium rhizoplanae]UCA61821.1 four helix bundle protein [Chryseobacterium rhizoplanae]
MAIYDQLPVYKAVYDLLLQLFEITKKMDRDFKFTIGEKIKTEAIELIVRIYRANSVSDKVLLLSGAKENVEVLRLLFRLMNDLKQVSLKEFVALSEKTESISKQINAWYLQQSKIISKV